MEGGNFLDFKEEIKKYSYDNLTIINCSSRDMSITGNIVDSLDWIADNNSNKLTISLDEVIELLSSVEENELSSLQKLYYFRREIIAEIKIMKNRRSVYLDVQLMPFTDRENGIDYYCGYIHDITEFRETKDKLRSMIRFDLITKLPSKYYLKKTIDDYLRCCNKNNVRGALVLLNIDDFKMFNDLFGHESGDILLKKVAIKLTEKMKENDLVCRYSGDEYIIFRPEFNSRNEAEDFVESILSVFKDPFIVNSNKIYVTASMGVSVFPGDGINFNTLLKNADTAMYRAKRNGKCEWEFFDSSITSEVDRIYNIEKGLRTALEKKEMYIVFQPKVSLSDSTVTGFEALLRWKSEKLGMVSPVEFIPIAEDTRLIIPIGRFVLEEVFKKVRELLDEGYDNFKVAVNFSDVQLRYGGIMNEFLELKDKYKVPTKYIELEITESILMKTFEDNVRRLKSIKKLGISVALDDFGTGYSSLNYLTKLPIDVLKIDRSFVVDMVNDKKSKCVVKNIIKLSHELGINVVAEGVEEVEQVDYLKDILCDVVQGYYYSKPEKFDDIKGLLGKQLA
ncbi:bifunctional diguanylate cyclase/phosphodiesterase [Clostridium sp. MSJ-8]|uniref:putative bifunctional diguanylate cyclase/phosphodiesterase n=1 Tax=Clostridium sp. MSJ-8 TaxID=2841510 RepID=UPI001C0ED272|nr:bifunctional diguanylate cyclase/phosphodiesterase [Clostridium sp. MSJ-8]